MTQLPLDDIITQPNSNIDFNAPFDNKHTYHVKVFNRDSRRAGFAIKTTKMTRLYVNSSAGVFTAKESVLLSVNCEHSTMQPKQRPSHHRLDERI